MTVFDLINTNILISEVSMLKDQVRGIIIGTDTMIESSVVYSDPVKTLFSYI